MENVAGGGGAVRLEPIPRKDNVELFTELDASHHPTVIDGLAATTNQHMKMDVYADLSTMPTSQNSQQPSSFNTHGKPMRSSLLSSSAKSDIVNTSGKPVRSSSSGKSDVIDAIRESELIVAALMGNTTSSGSGAKPRSSSMSGTIPKNSSFNATKTGSTLGNSTKNGSFIATKSSSLTKEASTTNVSGLFGHNNSGKIAVSNDLTGLLQAADDTPHHSVVDVEGGRVTQGELNKDEGKFPLQCHGVFSTFPSKLTQIFHSNFSAPSQNFHIYFTQIFHSKSTLT